MSARDELIRAYAIFKRTPVFAGDGDLGSKGLKIVRRKRVSVNKDTPAWNRDYIKCKKTRIAGSNSSNIISLGLYAGKIISAAEKGPHINQVYANYRYNDLPDHLIDGYERYICSYLIGRVAFNRKELVKDLVEGTELLIGVVNGTVTAGQAVEKKELFDYLWNSIETVNRGILIRVGKKIRAIKEAA